MLLRWIVVLLALVNVSCSEPIKTSVKVVDGDTVILMGAETQTLDLAYIDAPEREQPHGNEGKKFLKEKLQGDSVEFVITKDEQLEIVLEGKSLNLMMVEEGHAWAALRGSDPSKTFLYSKAQEVAVQHLAGLWGLGHDLMVAPWQWRQDATSISPSMHSMTRRHEQQRAQQKAQQEAQQEAQRRQQEQYRRQQEKAASMRNKVVKPPLNKDSN
jgi:micrococcal nuclease